MSFGQRDARTGLDRRRKPQTCGGWPAGHNGGDAGSPCRLTGALVLSIQRRLTGSTATGIQPPRDLGRHGTTLWNGVMSEYQIRDIGGVEILAQVCAALDTAEQCAEQIRTDGVTILTKTGLREHPSLKHELAARAFICRNLQRLGLNIETIKPVGRPPGSWTKG